MAGHTPDPPDTPESAAHSAAYRRAMEDARRLEAQWQAGQVPWVEAPAGDDPYLTTLRAYVEDLGGRLVLTAVFPEGATPRAPAPEEGHATVPAIPPGARER